MASANSPSLPGALVALEDVKWELYGTICYVADLDTFTLPTEAAMGIAAASGPITGNAELLHELACQLHARFHAKRDIEDLHKAISSLQRASELLCHDNEFVQPAMLERLGVCLINCFQLLGKLQDLDGAIAAFRRAVELVPGRNAEKPTALINCGNACLVRYRCTNNLEDLEAVVAIHRRVIELTPDEHSDKTSRLESLGNALRMRFERLGELGDLTQLISTFCWAVDLVSDNHPMRPDLFNKLGSSYLMRFERNGYKLDDIEQAVSAHRYSVGLTAKEDPHRTSRLNNLGISLARRFSLSQELDDIDEAISIHVRVVDLTLDGHPDKPSRLGNLGESTLARYTGKRGKESSDLEQAILSYGRAIELAPDDHPFKPSWYDRLGYSYFARFERTNDLEDLERALSANRSAVELAPDNHSDKPQWLITLGDSLRMLSRCTGKLEYIQQATEAYTRAVELTSKGHEDLPLRLSKLGSCLAALFERTGNPACLEVAVTAHRRAIELTPDDDPEKPFRLESLATSLVMRYERLGEIQDIEATISLRLHVAELVPDTHPSKPGHLLNLAGSLLRRHQGPARRAEDLGDSIKTYYHGLSLLPDNDPRKPAMFSDLCMALSERFDRFQELDDIETAISMGQRAVDLTQDGDPELASYIDTVAGCFHRRYGHTENFEDLSTAIAMFQRVVDLCPTDHPSLSLWLHNLGNAWKVHLNDTESQASFDAALGSFMSAATHPTGRPDIRLISAASCAWLLSKYPAFSSTEALLSAYSRIILIIPELIWLGFDIRRRLSDCAVCGNLVNRAVASAVDVDSLDHAVDWLEAGRSFIWSQVLSLRTPLDELQEKQPELASRLSQVQLQLQQSAPGSFVLDPESFDGVSGVAVSAAADRHRLLTFEYETLLQKIRRCTGFENFMKSDQLSSSVVPPGLLSGPVIFLNVYRTRCDAIIVHASGTRTLVPLPDLSLKRAAELRRLWVEQVMGDRFQRSRAAGHAGDIHGHLNSLTRYLGHIWNWIVQPVMSALELNGRPDRDLLPHVTWCPTGPLMQLPLHAAGLYDVPNGPRAYNFAVHSYTPSLSALARSSSRVDERQSPHDVLIISQPSTPGQTPLAGTVHEAARLENILRTFGVKSNWLNDTAATVEAVRSVTWVHLACHGSQVKNDPTQSAFALYDGRLTLSDLMSITADTAELAFLSACETAVGDERTPEESAHLAAGMLAVGFKGVVATMWSIQDKDAPVVVDAYYKELLVLRTSGSLGKGETGAAYALHEATRVLREQAGESAFMRWVPFVHFGI